MKLPIRIFVGVATLVTFALIQNTNAQTDTWDGGGGDNNFGTGNNWADNSSPGVGSGWTLTFAGSTRLSPYNNYGSWDDFGSWLFASGAGSFNITGNAIDLFGKIENNSSNNQTVGISAIGANGNIEFNPVSGDLTISVANIYNNGNQIRVYGANGNTVTFSSSVISGTGSFAILQNSTAYFKSAMTYSGETFISAGTLRFGSGGSANSSAFIRLGDTTGTANATLRVDGSVTLSSGDVVIRAGSSGVKTITTDAASGVTATISRNVYLDADVTVSSTTSGGTLSMSGTTFDLKNQTMTVSGSGDVTISSAISNSTGSGKLTKEGSGTLTLSGTTGNTFSGVTTINSGTLVLAKSINVNALAGTPTINNGATLRLGAANQFNGDSTFLTINSGGTFDLNGYSDTLAIQGAGAITLGSATLTINPTATDTYSGSISGSGGLIKANSGTQILSGSSAYTGTTVINAGIIEIQHGSGLGASGASQGTTVASGGQLRLWHGTGISVAEPLTLSGTGDTSGALKSVGGANTVSGGITLNADTRIQVTAGSLTLSGSVSAGANTLYLGGTQGITVSGNLSGTKTTGDMAVFIDNTGTTTFSGADNTGLTGNVRVNANGTILLGSGNALGGGNLTFAPSTAATIASTSSNSRNLGNSTTFIYGTGLNLGVASTGTGSLTFGAMNLGNDATGSNQRTITTAGGTSHTFGALTGGANNTLIKEGTGALNLSAASTTSGGVQLNNGTLLVGNDAALGTGLLQVQFDIAGTKTLASSSSAAYTLNNNINIYNDLTLGQTSGGTGSLTLGGTIQLGNEANQNRAITVNGSHTISGSIQGARGIVKQGGGTLRLSGANTSTGQIYIDDGIVDLNGGSLGNGTIEIGAGTGGAANATLRVTSGSFARGITVNSDVGAGDRTIDFANTSGTATLSGNVSIEKDAYVATASGGIGKLSGVITRSGTAGIIKTGAGTLDLGTQTHNVSSIALQGGTLLLGAANQLGTSTGSASSLNLSAGTTVKTAFDLTGNVLTLAGTSAQADTIFDFNSGSGNDFVFGSTSWSGGNLKLSNVAIGTIVNFGTFTGNAGLTFNDFQSKVSFTDTGLQAQINFSGTSLTVAAIPEPKVYVAAGALALLIGYAEVRRRKRAKSAV